MNCLCCGKPLDRASAESGWHTSCIERFFGTEHMPEIEMDAGALALLAEKTVRKGSSVPGVQKKLSLHLSSEKEYSKLTLVDYPAGYIFKPQVDEFESMPEAEQLVMCMADAAGISTVPHALLKNGDCFAYITKRIDRIFENNTVKMLAMEDFCQLDLRLTQDKYKGSYERCAKIIKRYSFQCGPDMTELYRRLVFSFLVGNSDMHLKNFSLIETEEGSGQYTLSPAYDLLPVNVVMPEDPEQLALTINGKKKNIRKKDFFVFADECELSRNLAEKIVDHLLSMKKTFLDMCEESYLPDCLKERFACLIEQRTGIF